MSRELFNFNSTIKEVFKKEKKTAREREDDRWRGLIVTKQRNRFERDVVSWLGEMGKGERGKMRVGEKYHVWGRERADAPVMRTGGCQEDPPSIQTGVHRHTHTLLPESLI